jgi:hypothetical protein
MVVLELGTATFLVAPTPVATMIVAVLVPVTAVVVVCLVPVVTALVVIVVSPTMPVLAAGGEIGCRPGTRGRPSCPPWIARRISGWNRLGIAVSRVFVERDARPHRANDEHRRRGRFQSHARAGGAADSRGAGRRFSRARSSPGEQRLQERQRDQHPRPVAERPSRSVDRLASGATGDAQRRRDLLVAEALQLAHHDRRALRLR